MTTQQQAPKPLTELDYLALTIWAEARGEGTDGMEMVAHVIRNRVENGKYGGKTYKGVTTKAKQFSCWDPGDPNRKLLTVEHVESLRGKLTPDAKAMVRAYTAARMVMTRLKDPTAGATHYHAARVKPYWAASFSHVTTIGKHLFYVT